MCDERGAVQVCPSYSLWTPGPSQLLNGESAVTIRMDVKTASGAFVQARGSDGAIDMTLQPGTFGVMTATGDFVAGRQRIQQRVSWASAPTYWPAIDIVMSKGDELNEFGTALTDRTMANSWGGGTRTTNYSILPPVAVYANLPTALPGVMIVGDSLTVAGNNDSTFGDYLGYVQRGLAAQVPWMLNGATGMSISSLMSDSTQVGIRFTQLLNLHPGIKYALDTLGTNDLVASQTSAQMLSYLSTLNTR